MYTLKEYNIHIRSKQKPFLKLSFHLHVLAATLEN